jgi:hypothetical protein
VSQLTSSQPHAESNSHLQVQFHHPYLILKVWKQIKKYYSSSVLASNYHEYIYKR